MSDKTKNVSVNFGGLLSVSVIGVILIIMKLGGIAPVAAWSWWLVTLPFWSGPVVLLLFATALLIVGALVALFNTILGRRP